MLLMAKQRRDTGFCKLSSAPLVLLSNGWRNSASVPPFAAFQELRAAWRTTISLSVGSLALSIRSSVWRWSALLTPRSVRARSFRSICALSLLEGCCPSWFTLACLVIQALHCKRPTKSDWATSLRSLPLDIWHFSLRMTPRRRRRSLSKASWCELRFSLYREQNNGCCGVA